MEIKKSVIKSIVPGNPWEGQYGKMYKVKLDLEGLSETLSKILSDSVNSNRTKTSSPEDKKKHSSKLYLM